MRYAHVILIVLIASAGIIPAHNDDIDFAFSLTEGGFYHRAARELTKLRKTGNADEKILALYGFGRLHEKQKNFPERDKFFKEFIEAGARNPDPRIRKLLVTVRSRQGQLQEQAVNRLIDAIQNEFLQEQPDRKKLADLSREVRPLAENLLRTRQNAVTALEKIPNPTDKEQTELDRSTFDLARSLYFMGLAHKNDNPAEFKRFLKEALDKLQPLDFMYGDNIPTIPFYLGLVLFELEEYKKAGRAFEKCLMNKQAARVPNMRLLAYWKSSESWLRINEYVACVRGGFDFMLEFPIPEERANLASQTIILNSATALYEMDSTDYKNLARKHDLPHNQIQGAQRLLEGLIEQNGFLAPRAEKELGRVGRGYTSLIARGVTAFREGRYNHAIPFLSKGLETAPAHLKPRQRLLHLARAWYYLGTSYHKREMPLEALVAFKQGTLGFARDAKAVRLGEGPPNWFKHNRVSWQKSAQQYHEDTKTSVSLEILKETLTALNDTEDGKRHNIKLSIIALNEGRYRDTLKLVKDIPADHPSFQRRQELEAKAHWGLYRESGYTLKDHSRKAYELHTAIRDRLRSRIGECGGKPEPELIAELAALNSRMLDMQFADKQYNAIIAGIKDFWEYPSTDNARTSRSIIYQIQALVMAEADAGERITHLAAGRDLLAAADIRNIPAASLLTAYKNLGIAHINFIRKNQESGQSDRFPILRSKAAELLHTYITTCSSLDTGSIEQLADIIHTETFDFTRSAEITGLIIAALEQNASKTLDPYDPITRSHLEQTAKILDRGEARQIWADMIDRMHDGVGSDGAQHDRAYFHSIQREAWQEQPYMYSLAEDLMAQALLNEVGFSIEESDREMRAARMSIEAEDALWARLFREIDDLNKESRPFREIRAFLQNRLKHSAYRERLADCRLKAGNPEGALQIYRELDRYYISEPETKGKRADTALALARKIEIPEQKQAYIEEARSLYLWLADTAPRHTEAGRREHYDAKFKVAACHALSGSADAAIKSLENTRDYSPFKMPKNYMDKITTLIKKYSRGDTGIARE